MPGSANLLQLNRSRGTSDSIVLRVPTRPTFASSHEQCQSVDWSFCGQRGAMRRLQCKPSRSSATVRLRLSCEREQCACGVVEPRSVVRDEIAQLPSGATHHDGSSALRGVGESLDEL